MYARFNIFCRLAYQQTHSIKWQQQKRSALNIHFVTYDPTDENCHYAAATTSCYAYPNKWSNLTMNIEL